MSKNYTSANKTTLFEVKKFKNYITVRNLHCVSISTINEIYTSARILHSLNFFVSSKKLH